VCVCVCLTLAQSLRTRAALMREPSSICFSFFSASHTKDILNDVQRAQANVVK